MRLRLSGGAGGATEQAEERMKPSIFRPAARTAVTSSVTLFASPRRRVFTGSTFPLMKMRPLSCSTAVSDFQGKAIATVEGLTSGNQLSRVQQAFVDAGAAQCGYCIPGFVVAVTGMLEIDPKPNAEAIQEALSFHLCRCGSHGRIKAAIDSLVGSAGSHE